MDLHRYTIIVDEEDEEQCKQAVDALADMFEHIGEVENQHETRLSASSYVPGSRIYGEPLFRICDKAEELGVRLLVIDTYPNGNGYTTSSYRVEGGKFKTLETKVHDFTD